jgi:hypothetical protein
MMNFLKEFENQAIQMIESDIASLIQDLLVADMLMTKSLEYDDFDLFVKNAEAALGKPWAELAYFYELADRHPSLSGLNIVALKERFQCQI